MSAKNKAIVETVNDAMRRMDIEGFLAYCADDFAWTMVGETPVRGKDALRMFAEGPGEPPAFSVHTLVADGDVVVAQGDMTMQEGGADVPYAFCDVWRFAATCWWPSTRSSSRPPRSPRRDRRRRGRPRLEPLTARRPGGQRGPNPSR